MKFEDVFKTPTVARLLDLLLAKPNATYLQSHITGRLGIDKATMRRTIARLQRLGLVDVDVNPAGVHLNAIMFNDETKQGKAALTFYRRIAALRLENKD
jgi:DNA-binding MarR family transcriptional regulator